VFQQLMTNAGTEKELAPDMNLPEEVFPTLAAVLKLSPGDRVLEVGSGDARVVSHLAAQHPECSFMGVELDEALHAAGVARLSAAPEGVAGRVELRCGDALALAGEEVTSVGAMYMYMTMRGMRAIYPWAKAHAAPGTRLITAQFRVTGVDHHEVEEVTYTDARGVDLTFRFYTYIL